MRDRVGIPNTPYFGLLFGTLAASWFAMICLGGIFQPSETLWMIILGIYSIAVSCLIVTCAGWMSSALIVGFVFRLVLLWLDRYTEVPIFSSGGDTENFYSTALAIYNDPDLFGSDLYGGVFPQLCGALFWIIGPSRLFVQYGNVIFSIAALAFIGLTLKELHVTNGVGKVILLICCLMPVPAAISSLFLRESLIFLLVSASLYAFIRWLTTGRLISMLLALVLVSLAATFHLGVLGLAVGYGFALLFFDRRRTKISFSFSNLARGLPIILASAFVITRFPGLFLEKLESVSSAEDAVAIATGSSAGSAYLTGMEIGGPLTFLLFGALKGLFLLVSPLPMDWRGLGDVISFGLDGMFYLVAIVVIFSSYWSTRKTKSRRLLSLILVGLVCAVLILGLGTSAAGTAMRHRQKVLPVIAVGVALSITVRRDRTALVESRFATNADGDHGNEEKL